MNQSQIEADIYDKGMVTRDHLLNFLRLQKTNDSTILSTMVTVWLNKLHDDPHYSKVVFPPGDVERILSDLESYGYVTHETIIGAPPMPELNLEEQG